MKRFTILMLVLAAITCGGCEEVLGLRFSPSEAMKQNAELTHTLARKINVEGCDPGSDASGKLVDGTEASLIYTGRPSGPVDPDDFATVNAQAKADSELRPDVAGAMDGALEVGIGIATLLGGAGAAKVVGSLRRVQAKAKAFNEVVSQTNSIKKTVSRETFKEAFENQTAATRKLVAEARAEIKSA